MTSIMFASMNGHLEVVKVLIEQCADIEAKGIFGELSNSTGK